MFKSIIELPLNAINCLFFISINKFKFLVINTNDINTSYIKIPFEIKVKKKNNFLVLVSEDNVLLISFQNRIKKILKNQKRVFFTRLSLRGLGFKITKVLENNSTFLKFKVGFSNLITIKEPTNKLSTAINKNKLYLFSPDLVFLGNFARFLRGIKKPNRYSGKGIFLKKEIFKKKAFKKK